MKHSSRFLEQSIRDDMARFAIGKLYRYLIYYAMVLSFFVMSLTAVVVDKAPYSAFQRWGLPLFLLLNISLGLSHFINKRFPQEMTYLVHNWMLAVVAAISSGFSVFPWLFFVYLSDDLVILLSLAFALTPLLASLTLTGSVKVWVAASLPVVASVVSYAYVAWDFHPALGQWFAIWLTIVWLVLLLLERQKNRLFYRTLAEEYNASRMVDIPEKNTE